MRRDERGATAVFLAAGMVLFLGIAAVAVDVGSGFAERRQAQSAADFSALAAVQFSNLDSGVPAECVDPVISGDAIELAKCRGAVEAMRVAAANLPNFTLDWAACTDADVARAALYPELPTVSIGGVPTTLDCIRFSGNSVSVTLQSRVVIPNLEVPTTFARVLGADDIDVSAPAEAEGEIDLRRNVLPFAIPSDHSANYECLKTGPNPDWGACKDLGSNGNFGYLDIPTYGVPAIGTVSDNCNPTNNSLTSNMVRGIDHELGTHSDGNATPAERARRDDAGDDTPDRQFVCPLTDGRANEVQVQTGVVTGVFEDGMIWGYGSTDRGRLWDDSGVEVRGPGGGDPRTMLDNTPLWSWLTTNDGSCPVDGDPADSTSRMIECLEDWYTDMSFGQQPIFEDLIKTAPRLALAPRLHTPFGPGQWYFIADLPPVYLDTTYWGCNANDCDVIHVPGVSGPTAACTPPPGYTGGEPPDAACGIVGSHTDNLDAITAYILDPGMFPADTLAGAEGPLANLSLTR